ncbi:MAG TPA: hypothetical protein VK281_19225, partial [Xanthobacteraceae bacterium]|nr:hypothetical protein [Xanthobacteraceae bacterium]
PGEWTDAARGAYGRPFADWLSGQAKRCAGNDAAAIARFQQALTTLATPHGAFWEWQSSSITFAALSTWIQWR